MLFKHVMMLWVGIGLLTACSAPPSPTATSTVVIVTPSSVPATATPRPSSTVMVLSSAVPLTRTPRPTKTATSTATPLAQVEWLPLTQEWEWDLNTAGECGYLVTTKSMTETVVALPDVMGVLLRAERPPLLFTCITRQVVTLQNPIT